MPIPSKPIDKEWFHREAEMIKYARVLKERLTPVYGEDSAAKIMLDNLRKNKI